VRGSRELLRRKIEATRIIYNRGQYVRLEWETASGGTDRPGYDTSEGATITTHVEDDVRALKRSLGLNELKLVNDARLNIGDAVWSFLPTVNFSVRKRLTIVHKLVDQKVSGTGTGTSNVWTASGTAYTVDEHAGKWLFLDDSRFQVESNTADTLTLELNGGTLAASGSFELMPASEWYPMIQNPDQGDMLTYGIMDGATFLDIFCKPEPYAGGENQI